MTETSLTPISQAQQMLAAATTPTDFRNLRDYASSARTWAKARGMGIDAENEAAEIILRAERAIGLIILDLKEQGIIGEGNPQLRTGQEVLTISEITGNPPKDKRNWDWQQLAKLDDETFDRMIATDKELGQRIAKINYYSALQRATTVRTTERPTPSDPGYTAFRDGANLLLGWQVDDEGNGRPTKNGLLSLPEDQLLSIAMIIRELVNAYNEARMARG